MVDMGTYLDNIEHKYIQIGSSECIEVCTHTQMNKQGYICIALGYTSI